MGTPHKKLKDKALLARLKVHAPATLEDIANFELKSGVSLPEDYAFFLTNVGNGGAEPCRLLPLERWDAGFWSRAHLESDLRRPCVITPEAEALGENWLDQLGIKDWEERWDNDEWDPLYGTIAIAEIGCGLFYFLIMNGDFFGRIFSWGDQALKPPIFLPDTNFSHWMERHLDAMIIGKPVHFLNGPI